MLGAAASEIANMDATSKMRRQKLEAIKSHLRYLRVPGFLTVPIMEFYETLLSKKQALDDNDILCAASAARTMPPEPCTPGRTWPLPSLTLPYTPLLLPLYSPYLTFAGRTCPLPSRCSSPSCSMRIS